MKIITSYAPPTFMKPCIVFSTLAHETAIAFIEALNADTAIAGFYKGGYKKTDWITLKKHSTPSAAIKYHMEIAKLYRNGESEKLWNKGFEPYLKLVRLNKDAIEKAGIEV